MTGRPRILVIGLAHTPGLRDAALQASMLVGVGGDDEVRAARREFVDLDNVMFTLGSRDDIPWGDGHFSSIVDLESGEPTAEMLRVLMRDGRIYSSFLELRGA